MSTWKKVLLEDDAVGGSGLSMEAAASGSNVTVTLSDGTNTDPVLITAGSNVSFSSVAAGGFTITSANDNTQLTQEQVEDYVGGMLDGTETGISVSYDDDGGANIDFVVDDQTLEASDPNADQTVVRLTKSNPTTADTVDITAGSNITFSSITAGGFTIASANDNTQLSQEAVEDYVGGMLDGTETGISVSYDDDGGANIDFVVDDQTLEASDPNADQTVVRLTKSNPTTADTVDITAGSNITFSSITAGGFTIASANDNTQLSQEAVEDYVGGMLDGTETGISVSYDDDGGANIDFVVDDQTLEASDPNADQSVVRLTKSNPTTADTVDITAGSNITFSSISAGGFTIAATQDGNDDVSDTNLRNALAALEPGGGTLNIGDSGDDLSVVIRGNLQVDGTTTTINSTTLTVDDTNIVVASGAANAGAADGAGIEVDVDADAGYATNPQLQWNATHETFSQWKMVKGVSGETDAFIAGMVEAANTTALDGLTPGVGTLGLVGGALYFQTA